MADGKVTEKERFMERLVARRAEGLVDMKFFTLNGDSLSEEEFFAASNAIDFAVQEGRCVRTEEWDQDIATQEFAPLLA